MDLCIEGNEQTRSVNTLDLKNPYFRYTGQPVAPPPGMSNCSPSEAYWTQLDAQGARQGDSWRDKPDISKNMLFLKFSFSKKF